MSDATGYKNCSGCDKPPALHRYGGIQNLECLPCDRSTGNYQCDEYGTTSMVFEWNDGQTPTPNTQTEGDVEAALREVETWHPEKAGAALVIAAELRRLRESAEPVGDAETEEFWETVRFSLVGESNFQHNRNKLPKHHPDGVPREFGTQKEKEIEKAKQMLPRMRSLLVQREKELAALRGFAVDVMKFWPDYDLDGGDLQEIAEKFGLIKPIQVSEPCGPSCSCAEYDSTFPTTCYRRQPIISPNPETRV